MSIKDADRSSVGKIINLADCKNHDPRESSTSLLGHHMVVGDESVHPEFTSVLANFPFGDES